MMDVAKAILEGSKETERVKLWDECLLTSRPTADLFWNSFSSVGAKSHDELLTAVGLMEYTTGLYKPDSRMRGPYQPRKEAPAPVR